MTTTEDAAKDDSLSLHEMVQVELAALGVPTGSLQVESGDDGREPYVSGLSEELVGLAFSGGGIRSSTFCLGVLQGLHDLERPFRKLRVLGQFHYLATVSGGGYVGGWWSAYRQRGTAPDARSARFPDTSIPGTEPPEIRHLREFGNFLTPRRGLFEIETWQFLSSILMSALPSLVIAAAVLTLIACAWLVLLRFTVVVEPAIVAPTLAVGTALFLLALEWKIEPRERADTRSPWMHGVLVFAVAVATWLSLLFLPAGRGPLTGWDAALSPSWVFAPRTLAAWGSVLAALIALRIPLSYALARRRKRLVTMRGAVDRVAGRVLGLTVAWTAGVGLVWAAGSLDAALDLPLAGVGVGSSALFALIWRFANDAPTRARVRSVVDVARGLSLRVLAYVALAIALILVIRGVLAVGALGTHPLAVLAAVAACVLVLVAAFFDPNEIGLHSFYRARIARAYLGASNIDECGSLSNRGATLERPSDDLVLADLSTDAPLHLICCAANHLGSGALRSLDRGARSATLSRLGFSVGDVGWRWHGRRRVTLASAVTASAAAINPAMGSVSLEIGGAATFLLAALNLRLGYWLLPRGGTWRLGRWLPGVRFLSEMFGRVRAHSGSHAFHLSDGGHFDNTALYELLRRHCRYILLCDCGKDPDKNFDDLGNALRRAREDFGVEIDLDLTPLRPDERGFSPQHVAVGDVRYPDGDVGVILVLKPTLVGDEPDDVLQYRSRNPAFPHESTGDQFYDEKQWESYRRLGQHAARITFGFLSRWKDQDTRASWIFGRARFAWYPAPPGLEERVLARAGQLGELEVELARLRENALSKGFFLELLHSGETLSAPSTARLPDVLTLFTRVMQLFEDVYTSCQLERHVNHPLNMGWMNAFGRWATMPMLRAWWPLLAPMYNPMAMRFAEQWFALRRLRDDLPAEVRPDDERGLATLVYRDMHPKDDLHGTMPFRYLMRLPIDSAATPMLVEVAVAFLETATTARPNEASPQAEKGSGKLISWTASRFFVPPSFWGAGIGGRFLGDLVDWFEKPANENLADVLRVDIELERRDEAALKQHADLVQLYREAGFKTVERSPSRIVLERKLKRARSDETNPVAFNPPAAPAPS